MGGLKVLIVDDNETNRQILLYYMESWGMRAASAGGGEPALKILEETAARKEPFDLAVLDLLMPSMDGIQLAREIKKRKSLAGTKLILLSSFTKRGLADESKRVGFDGFLVKPVRQSQLYDCLALVMGGKEEEIFVTKGMVEEKRRKAKSADLKGKVLLAEDNPVNQKVAVLMLEKMGLRVDVASDGREALDAIKQRKYDLVLMDCQMPEMDGYQATIEIRKLENEGERIPVIAMTANALEGDREKCLQVGMDDYIPKPVRKDNLEAVIKKWLKKGKRGRP